MKSLIHTSYSPNTRIKDLLLNKLLLSLPIIWKRGNGQKNISQWFSHHYNVKDVFTFNYARSGMYVLFKTLFDDPKTRRETSVAIQGFTCVAAVNPVIWAGYKIKYIDIDPKTLNMSLDDLKKKIDESTKVVMFQHTLGNSTGIEEIANFCKEKGHYKARFNIPRQDSTANLRDSSDRSNI